MSLPLACVLLVVSSSVAVAPVASAQVTSASRASAAAPAAAEAPSDTAARTGRRVEVVAARSATETTYANPDGTFTLETSAAPVHGRTVGGAWQDIALTLEKQPDGTVRPHAPALEVRFSGGGSAPLVQLTQDGHSFSLGWSSPLPAPVLDGDAAVYGDVLPGVDLRLTATEDGYRQALIVKTREAAASPALRDLRFTLDAPGLTVRETRDGGLQALDADANVVFAAPPAQMWDSHGSASVGSASQQGTPSAAKALAPSAPSVAVDGQGTSAGDGEVPDPAVAPIPGSAEAPVAVAVTDDHLVLHPDESLLTGPDTVFPVYVDPGVGINRQDWLLVSTTGEHTFRWSNGKRGEGVGYCGALGACGNHRTRQLYSFGRGQLAGKVVLDASMRISETWSVSCKASVIALYRAGAAFTSKTTWKTQPALKDLLVDENVSAGRGSACGPEQPQIDVTFNDDSAVTKKAANFTNTIKAFAANKYGTKLYLTMRAGDEDDDNSWKRFLNNAALIVTYVAVPGVPTGVGLMPYGNAKTACPAKPADQITLGDSTPQVQAVTQLAVAPAKGEDRGALRAVFAVERYDAATKAWTQVWSDDQPDKGTVTDNSPLRPSTAVLSDQRQFRYHALTRSYYTLDGKQKTLDSAWSGYCYFTIDTTAPKAPTITSALYEKCTADVCRKDIGGPGKKGSFTFTPASGDTNVTGYRYSLSTGSGVTAVAGSPVTVPLTPTLGGEVQLVVEAKDVAGRYGAPASFAFFVAQPAGTIGAWSFGEATGTTAADASAGKHALTLQPGATLDLRGRRATGDTATDHAVLLDGAKGYAATAAPVLNTGSSFTVSAWVYLTDPSHDGTAVAQADTDDASQGFSLGYSKAAGAWTFAVHRRTAAGAVVTKQSASTGGSPPTGVWTHLAGVYDTDPDAAASTVQLFVNGRPQPAVTLAKDDELQPTLGPLTVGRTNVQKGVYGAYFEGLVDEVTAWQQASTADELAPVAEGTDTTDRQPSLALVGAWSADLGSGTTVPDASTYTRSPLTLAPGAVLDDVQDVVVLDGATGHADATGPVVDDSGSFTVSVAAKLDPAVLAGKPVGYRAQVVGQRSAADGKQPSWAIWYEQETAGPNPGGRWHFGRTGENGAGDVVASLDAAGSDGAVLGDEVQLTGVYDAPSGTVRLYVEEEATTPDKADDGDVRTFTPLRSATGGPVTVGRGLRSGTWGDYLPGEVSSVRLWAGPMTTAQVVERIVNAGAAQGTAQ